MQFSYICDRVMFGIVYFMKTLSTLYMTRKNDFNVIFYMLFWLFTIHNQFDEELHMQSLCMEQKMVPVGLQ